MKFLKFVVLVLIVMIFLIAGNQFATYWLGMRYFDFSSTIATGGFHLFVLGALIYAFYRLFRYKV